MPMIPTIHTNGTPPDALRKAAEDTVRALNDALDTMCEQGANARDYYPQGADAAIRASREHEDRMKRLRAIRDESQAIYDGIEEQMEARDAQRR